MIFEKTLKDYIIEKLCNNRNRDQIDTNEFPDELEIPVVRTNWISNRSRKMVSSEQNLVRYLHPVTATRGNVELSKVTFCPISFVSQKNRGQ